MKFSVQLVDYQPLHLIGQGMFQLGRCVPLVFISVCLHIIGVLLSVHHVQPVLHRHVPALRGGHVPALQHAVFVQQVHALLLIECLLPHSLDRMTLLLVDSVVPLLILLLILIPTAG